MTVRECYAQMGADYEDVLERLMNDERIQKYLIKFKNANMFQDICDALAAQDYETAFRNVHSLKGMSLNLSLTKLGQSSHILCEALRGGKPTQDITPLLEAVRADYEQSITAIDLL